ncbi:MAG: leucyl aminopeptidase [Fidelibacterota bacterium]
MKFTMVSEEILKSKRDLYVVGLFKADEESYKTDRFFDKLNETFGGALSDMLDASGFVPDFKKKLLFYTGADIPSKRVLFIGLGEADKFNIERARQAAGTITADARESNVKSIVLPLFGEEVLKEGTGEIAQAEVEGFILGSYRFLECKTEEIEKEKQKEVEEISFLSLNEADAGVLESALYRGKIIAEAANYARDLASYPGNRATPTMLAEEALKIAEDELIKCTIFEREDMERMGMGAFVGVARGSEEPPKFIVLDYNPPSGSNNRMLIIGKGLTFDSGGISIKPGKNMEEMKFDMSGAAAVLGIMKVLPEIKIPHRVIGVIPATENLPGGRAYKPGDILTSYSGKTIEVISTDAEGRLILADAISFAIKEYNPSAIIDLATLTGACVVALGHHATGLMGNNQSLMEKIKDAAELTGEKVWELPLWDEYSEQIKSDFADVKNTGGPDGGAITAAAFLKKFVGQVPWIHLDIAGTAWDNKDKPYIPKGPSGFGVRLIVQFLNNY